MPIASATSSSLTQRILWLTDSIAWIFVPVVDPHFPPQSSLGLINHLLRGDIRRMIERVASREPLKEPLWIMGERFFFRGLALFPSPPLPPLERALHLVPRFPKAFPSGIRILLPPPEIERELPPGAWRSLNDAFPGESILFLSLLEEESVSPP